MQNIPVFTAANGMASLVLREIPYSGAAYVLLRAVWNGQTKALLDECAGFCRAAGAQRVYASDGVKPLPGVHAYDMLRLTVQKADLPPVDQAVELIAVTEENGEEFLAVYNSSFRALPGAASYDKKDIKRLIETKSGFLVYEDSACAAVAELDPDGLAGIAVLPRHRGLGYRVAITALHRLEVPVLQLKVASTNDRALSLYRRLGFGNDTCISRWWLI